jgi:tRNA pseudouridine55 synthase
VPTMGLHGVLNIDKPQAMTSHDVVDEVRKVAGTRRVGHTGTLDPMATGVLVLCIGKGTKIAQYLVGLDKEYEAEIVLGVTSSTYDATGEKRVVDGAKMPDRKAIEAAVRKFTGKILQTPPPYSAVKVKGRRLYEYARQGLKVDSKAREVNIKSVKLLSFAPPHVRFVASVSSGTYIRSLCHDIGLSLGCGAHLTALCRTRLGCFLVKDALSLAECMSWPGLLAQNILSLSEALSHLPAATVYDSAIGKVKNGRPLHVQDVQLEGQQLGPGLFVRLLSEKGELLAIAGIEPMREEHDFRKRTQAQEVVFKPRTVLC